MTSLLTTDQLDLLREAHYEGAAYLIAGPQAALFAARVNGAPSGNDFAQITFDTVTIGAYTDLIVDMDVRISHTNDVRAAFFYGRVRKTPTSTILYINETSAAILDNDYVFAVDSYPMVIRQRYKTFVDWDRSLEPLPPIESNVPSASVVLTAAATAEFSLLSVGQALEKSATISSRLWTIPGASYTVGSSTSANITFTVTTPYNKWCHLRLTDSNGTTNTLHFTLTAGNPNTAPFFRLCHDPVPVSSDWDNGLSSSATYWAGIEDLLDRTRITLVTEETFDGEVLGVSNIAFVGYLHSSTSTTQGHEVHGQEKEAALDFNGLMQLAGQLRFNQIAIRYAAVPAAWDYINVPTPPRNIVHLFAHHSTFLNLCSLDLSGIDETYLTGNTNIDETSLTDAARKAVKEITGYLVQSADGIVTLVRDPRLNDNTYRASLPDLTPEPIDLGDVYSYKLTAEPYDKVGWEDVGFLVVNPSTLGPTFITANAPASGPGDGQEDAVEPSQLLAATTNLADALTEAGQRTADLYELANTHFALEVNFGSGWGGVVRATPGVYYQFLVPADDDVRGAGISDDTNWLCLSVNTTINRSGTQDTIGQFKPVTVGGNALINASISPSVVSTPETVRPYVSPYPSQPMAASINSDTVGDTTRHHRDPFSGMQPLPLKTEEAAAAAQNQAGSDESKAYTNFRYGTNIAMGFTTVLGADYLLMVSGSAKVVDGIGIHLVPYSFGLQADIHYVSSNGDGDLYRIIARTSGSYDSLWNVVDRDGTSFTVTEMSMTSGTWLYSDANLEGGGFVDSDSHSGGMIGDLVNYVTPFLIFGVTTSYLGATLIRVKSTSLTPPDTATYADAFYTWNLDDDGNPINVQLNAGGLRLDNAAVAVVPPFDPNHIYSGIPFTGTGNPINFKYMDSNYADNQSAPLYLTAKGEGAGS